MITSIVVILATLTTNKINLKDTYSYERFFYSVCLSFSFTACSTNTNCTHLIQYLYLCQNSTNQHFKEEAPQKARNQL